MLLSLQHGAAVSRFAGLAHRSQYCVGRPFLISSTDIFLSSPYYTCFS